MGDRALPRVNKLIYSREQDYTMHLHRQKMTQIKPNINNRPPPEYSHMLNQAKKKQMQLGAFAPLPLYHEHAPMSGAQWLLVMHE